MAENSNAGKFVHQFELLLLEKLAQAGLLEWAEPQGLRMDEHAYVCQRPVPGWEQAPSIVATTGLRRYQTIREAFGKKGGRPTGGSFPLLRFGLQKAREIPHDIGSLADFEEIGDGYFSTPKTQGFILLEKDGQLLTLPEEERPFFLLKTDFGSEPQIAVRDLYQRVRLQADQIFGSDMYNRRTSRSNLTLEAALNKTLDYYFAMQFF